jgi:hypothetical protein
MAEMKRTGLLPVAELAANRMHEAMEAAIAEEPIVPNGTGFVGVDAEREATDMICWLAREGRPTLLVFEDGEEILLTPSKPQAEK